MKQHVKVGLPIRKNGKLVEYEDVQTIPSNRAFNYNRRGYVTIQSDDDTPHKKVPEKKADKKKAAKKK